MWQQSQPETKVSQGYTPTSYIIIFCWQFISSDIKTLRNLFWQKYCSSFVFLYRLLQVERMRNGKISKLKFLITEFLISDFYCTSKIDICSKLEINVLLYLPRDCAMDQSHWGQTVDNFHHKPSLATSHPGFHQNVSSLPWHPKHSTLPIKRKENLVDLKIHLYRGLNKRAVYWMTSLLIKGGFER